MTGISRATLNRTLNQVWCRVLYESAVMNGVDNERELRPVPGIKSPDILHHSLLADVVAAGWRYREFIVFQSTCWRTSGLNSPS